MTRNGAVRWVIFGAILTLMAASAFFHLLGAAPREPEVIDDGFLSDSGCADLLVRVARREGSVFEDIRKGQKPIGMVCSNTDVAKAMRSQGAVLNEIRSDGSMDFYIRSKEKWLFARRSRFGRYEKDRIFVGRDDRGVIRIIWFDRPYIT